jgi:transposase
MDDLAALSQEELIALVQELRQRVADLEEENGALRAQLAQGGKGDGHPQFIKPNRPPRGERGKRKKRAVACVRRRETATEEAIHALEHCPDCGHKLAGGWVQGPPRQVIELPDTPVRIINHVLLARYCGICGKSYLPKLGPAEGVLGQHRFGIRFMGMVALLSAECRMPQETIQGLLQSVYGVHVSVGEISEILHVVAAQGQGLVEGILDEIRKAPFVHGDETGWREDGVSGYLWSFSTPTARYFYRDPSRKGQVAKDALGEDFAGALICDFYSGYSWYAGPIQRCWDHFCRDLKDLKGKHAEDGSATAWVGSVLDVYRRAKEVAAGHHSEAERRRWRCQLEQEVLALAKPYAKDKAAPQQGLAERIVRFQSELFTFVQHAGLPSGNNAAERAIRPAVVARKVSGGTRSEKGSKTKAALMTLFGTWKLRGQDRLAQCLQMLAAPRTAAARAPQ